MSESISAPSSSDRAVDYPALERLDAPKPDEQRLEDAVAYVLVDCCFAVGQAIGMRTTVDYDAITWWHDHFRSRFLAAMRCHGNRWMLDRENVTGVGWMLAERALKHAADRDSIDVESARRAAADVERYCALHAQRAQRVGGGDLGPSRMAGYWCLRFPR